MAVLVVGDVMVDEMLICSSNRLSPEAPVPVAKIESQSSCLGGAGNVAINLINLIDDVTLMGAWPDGYQFSDIELAGITPKRLCSANKITRKTRIICRGQHLLRLDIDGEVETPDTERQTCNIMHVLSSGLYDAIILSDYDKGILDHVPAISELKKFTKFVLVDPKKQDWNPYRYCDVITPNEKEFELAFGGWVDEAELSKIASAVCEEYEIGHILLTRSEKGMTLYRSSGRVCHIDTEAQTVRDVTGAGDTVIATLCVGLLSGLDIEKASIIANKSAGHVIGFSGTHPIEKKTFERLASNSGHVKLKEYKKVDEKIVFTNGCFDILHPGHMSLLKHCRSLGGRVIVGLNSDESVKSLKGDKRPINNEEHRKEMLLLTDYVDEVIIFGEQTPYQIITKVKPDVLVKGGDYDASSVVGGEFVTNNSGYVEIFNFVPGFSTSAIIDKIKISEI